MFKWTDEAVVEEIEDMKSLFDEKFGLRPFWASKSETRRSNKKLWQKDWRFDGCFNWIWEWDKRDERVGSWVWEKCEDLEKDGNLWSTILLCSYVEDWNECACRIIWFMLFSDCWIFQVSTAWWICLVVWYSNCWFLRLSTVLNHKIVKT